MSQEPSYKEAYQKAQATVRRLQGEIELLRKQNAHLRATISGLQKRLTAMRKELKAQKET